MSFKRIIFIIIGSLSLVLGIIGIFIPLLPTTPFILLTAYLYAKSSKRLYDLLITNKIFGKYLENYRQGRGIPKYTKIVAITTLWISILYANFYLISLVFIKALFTYIAIMVTVHIAGNETSR